MAHNQIVDPENKLDMMKKDLDRAVEGKLVVRPVLGEGGDGKSFMIRELVRHALEHKSDAVVVAGACDPQCVRTVAYLPFADMLAQLTLGEPCREDTLGGDLGEQLGERLNSRLAVSAATLIELAPDLIPAFALGTDRLRIATRRMATQPDLGARLDKASKLTDLSAVRLPADRVVSAFADLIQALSRKFPLVLVLEDLQWADDSSLALLSHLLDTLGNCPLLLLLSCRRGEMDARLDALAESAKPVAERLRAQFGEDPLDLGAADGQRRQTFSKLYLAAGFDGLDDSFCGKLSEKTRESPGSPESPLFVAELLHHLQERGLILCDGQGKWSARAALDWSQVPNALERVIDERLRSVQRFGGEVYDILAAASVQGTTFSLPVLMESLGRPEMYLLKPISILLDKRFGLVREAPLGRVNEQWVGRYRFQNAAVQQRIYLQTSRRARQILHDRIARALEKLYGDRATAIAAELARHHDLAGNYAEASVYYLKAGQRALAIGSYRAAADLTDRAMRMAGELAADEQTQLREAEIRSAYEEAIKAVAG